MRSRCSLAVVCALSCALVACSSPMKPRARASGLPPEVTLYGQNLLLLRGAERAPRIAFDAFDPSARLIVETKPETASVVACPLRALDATIGDPRACHTVGSGVREEIAGPAMRAIAIVLLAPARATANVVMAFDERDRHVRIVLPLIETSVGAACGDNACGPFFEMQPVRNGAFRATATFGGGPASFDLLQGTVLGRSYTATGVPYRQAGHADGASPLRLSAEMSAPGEYALALRDTGGSGLSDVTVDATWS